MTSAKLSPMPQQ